MNFNDLMQRMRELDQPVPEMAMAEEPNEGNEFSGELKKAKEAGKKEFQVDGKTYQVKEDGTVEECGPMPMAPPMNSPMDHKPDTPPPSMNLSLNAQGMDNIESLMKLVTKVNPDMHTPDMPSMPPLPSLTMEPKIASIKPELPPLKMLPLDMGKDMDDGPEMDNDSDMGDEPNKKDEWANSPDGASEPEVKGMDAAVPNGDDLNRSKGTYPKVAGGDNPMQKDAFRESIRAELQRRLNEAKKS